MDGRTQESMNDARSDAGSIFQPLWRRKWFILIFAVLVAAATYEYYRREQPTFQAKTVLYLGGATEQSGGSGSGTKAFSTRSVADQVELINTTIVERLRKKLRAEHKPGLARTKAKAASGSTSDFITIIAEGHNRKVAARFANDLAASYIRNQRSNYVRNLQNQIANAKQQLRRIEPPPVPAGAKSKGKAPGQSAASTIQAASLESHINQLETNLATFTGVQQLAPAKVAAAPLSPKKNAIFGFVIGLIAASVLAYFLARFDRRVRTLSGAEGLFQAPVLAALPAVGSPTIRPRGGRGPAASLVEPLRRLNTALRLSHNVPGRNGGPRTLLFVSPDPGDGRSSVVANLARVQRDSGQRVMVVEADFRRPALGRLMDVPAARGLADVLVGGASPNTAAQTVALDGVGGGQVPHRWGGRGTKTMVEARTGGALSVLLAGGPVPNPPAALGSEMMSWVVRTLAEEYDSVLIDAPSPLEVSDAMSLLPLVDGIVIVARLGHTRIGSAERLMELLERTVSAPTLGTVVNCVPRREIARYGFSVGPGGGRRWPAAR
jgi:Mrp family chromosome partitioning ATPase/capsular polysaccharide biosynthesis protein